jgi:membrane protein DedA with SNARE-associated domain
LHDIIFLVQLAGHLLAIIERWGYLVVFLGLVAEGVGIPLPGETILITAGAFVHYGSLNLGGVLLFGILGTVTGGQLGYWAGRKWGRPFVLRWGRYVFVTPERLGKAESFFARHGGKAVFFARFVVGLRVLGAIAAGTSGMPWEKFLLYNALGGAMWAVAGVGAGYFLWASIGTVEHWFGRASLVLAAAVVLALVSRWAYRRATRSIGGEDEPSGGDGADEYTSNHRS